MSTATHSEANINQLELIWNLKFLQCFSNYSLRWIWSQSEANLKYESPIWNLKSQSEPIWTNLKSEVFMIFQTTSLKWIWKKYEANLKSVNITPQWRPVSMPSSQWLVSLLPYTPPPPQRPGDRPWLASLYRPLLLLPWPAVRR